MYDALVVVADWLRETAQDDLRDALLSMRVEGHGEPLSVAGHLTRLRPTEECDPTDSDGAAPTNAREIILQRVYGAQFVAGAYWRCVDCGHRTDLRVWHIVAAHRDEHPDAWSAKCGGCALESGLQDSVWPG